MFDPRRLVAIPLLALSMLAVVQAGGLVSQNLQFTRVQTELGFWGRGDYRPQTTTIEQTGRAIRELLDSDPAQPDYLALQANFSAWQAFRAPEGPTRSALAARAIDSQVDALRSRPAHRQSWQALLEYTGRTPGNAALHAQASARLAALARE